jgi:hypothetical protein
MIRLRRVLAGLGGFLLAATAGGTTPLLERARLPLDKRDAAAVGRARAGAVQRIRTSPCRALLEEYRDATGHTLEWNLHDSRMSAADHLGMLRFVNGFRDRLCASPKIALVTVPGGKQVIVCGTFANLELRQPRLAEYLVIHEFLHTLGLGENPPSSLEITARVGARCGDQPSAAP